MPKGRLDVISIIPGPKNVTRLVQRFGQNEYGLVTSLNDSQLPMLRAQLGDRTMVDVKSFGEVVRQVHLLTGMPPRRIATSRQILTAISIVCSEIGSDSPFRKVADMPGFHECLLEAFRELGHWGVIGATTVDVQRLAAQTGLAKIGELIEIFNEVISLLERANATIVAKMIAECLDTNIDTDGQDSRLQFFMGSTVHPMAIRWIKWLVEEGAEVEVILDRHATDGDIFQLSKVVAAELEVSPAEPGEGSRLINNLFAKEKYSGADLDWVELHCCGDPLAECEWALRRCLEIGDYAATAILTRNLDKYGPILLHAGESLGVPVESRRRIPLLASGFAKVTLAALKAVASDDVRVLATPLKTSYFGIDDLTQLLNEVHHGPEKDWEALGNYLDHSTEIDDSVRVVLSHFRTFRTTCFEKARGPADWHSELKTFLESAPWLDNAQERDLRAQTSMLSNLAQDATIQLIQTPDPMTYHDWLSHAERVWGMSDVSVPSTGDGVLLVSSPEELSDIDNLFVLGMLEGSFPRRRSEDAILSDDLKRRLSELIDGPPMNDSFDIARSERDLFYRVCTCPAKALYFSYPMSDGESDNVPAFYLEEVKRICGIEGAVVHPRRLLTPPVDECQSPRDIAIAERIQHPSLQSVDNVLKDERAVETVRFDMADVNPRSLRSLVECNYKFSAERLLPEQQQANDHWGWLLEVPRRAQLLTISDIRAARAEMKRVLDEYLDELRPRLPAWEFEMMYHGSTRLVEGLVEREFASRDLWGRDPRNTVLDVKFGDPQLNPERFKYRLSGKVEGITDQDGVRIVHLYRRTPPKDTKEAAIDLYLSEYGMYFASAWEGVSEVRLEIDGLSDHRTTLLFSEFTHLNKQGEQFLVLNLSRQFGNKIELADRMKDLLRNPKAIAVSGQMTTRAGDHCTYCSYADLCRQSLGSSDDIFDFGGGTSG
ncbi:MAG: hypothetical protein JST51_20240 [Armatimonadetes bacterium]|nr:hypothetical protein [Armatimonadota bacterium]